jgi:hypothetical protein
MEKHEAPPEPHRVALSFDDGNPFSRFEWGAPVRLDNLVDPWWVEQALARDLREFVYCDWHTDVVAEVTVDMLAAILPADMQVLTRGTKLRSKVQHAVVQAGDALVCLEISEGHVWAGVAAATPEEANAVIQTLDPLFPEPTKDEPEEPSVKVQVLGHGFGEASLPRLVVEPWTELAGNYAPATRAVLDDLMDPDFAPSSGGRLLIWHGEPGTGKSYAAATLAYEWRSWCRTKVVSDPEALLTDTSYLRGALFESEPTTTRPWVLVVLEDTGELFSADAKARTGQALSRLLNLTDGMLGRGSKALVLVTTNEPTGAFDGAITRPGRCLARVEFEPLPAAEARAWLTSRGATEAASAVTGPATIAELYGMAEGRLQAPAGRAPVGFVKG